MSELHEDATGCIDKYDKEGNRIIIGYDCIREASPNESDRNHLINTFLYVFKEKEKERNYKKRNK